MAGITFSGLATGMDTDSIVSQLMEIERLPIDRLEAKKKSETARLEAYAQFDSIMDDLKDAVSGMTLTSQIRSSKINLKSDAAYSATSTNAVTGSYDISVAQLSQVQKNISDGWSSKTTALLGSGTFTVNGTELTIDSTNNTLSGLATAINEISDTTGVTASIINDGTTGSPYRMVFTGADASSSFTISSDLVAADSSAIAFSTTQAQTAQQAVAFIDGIKVVSDTNTLTDSIGGLSISLNKLSEMSYAGTAEAGVDSWDWADPPVYVSDRMTVEPDADTLKEKVTTFVSIYNKAMEWINSGYEERGGTTTSTDEDGNVEDLLGSVLRGDSSINTIKRGLQSVLSTSIDTTGSMSVLSQLGISTQLDGTLNVDDSKLDSAITDSYDDVVHLLSGEGEADGVMKKFNYYLLDVTSGSSGMYATKKNNYDLAIKRIDTNIMNMEPRMASKEATLRSQFLAMEQLVSGFNAQGSFLTQQMDMLSNMISGK